MLQKVQTMHLVFQLKRREMWQEGSSTVFKKKHYAKNIHIYSKSQEAVMLHAVNSL